MKKTLPIGVENFEDMISSGKTVRFCSEREEL